MITKQQQRIIKKELAKDIGAQLFDIRHENKLLLSQIQKKYKCDINSIDAIETGKLLYNLHDITFVASIYNKKVKITFIDV